MASLAEILKAKKAASSPSSQPSQIAKQETVEVKEQGKKEQEKKETGVLDVESLVDDYSMFDTTNMASDILEDAEEVIEDIIPRIRQLSTIGNNETLEKEMKLLKGALMANPAAVELMLPTDVGMLVAALRRIVGEAIVAAAPKAKAAKPKKPKIEDLALGIDEF